MQFATREDLQTLQTFNSLNDTDKKTLILKLHGKNQKQIGDGIGAGVNSVRKRLLKIRKIFNIAHIDEIHMLLGDAITRFDCDLKSIEGAPPTDEERAAMLQAITINEFAVQLTGDNYTALSDYLLQIESQLNTHDGSMNVVRALVPVFVAVLGREPKTIIERVN